MNTRLCLLVPFCLAAMACTDADSPPPRGTFSIAPGGGCGLTNETVPADNTVIGRLAAGTPEETLLDMSVLKDGDGGAELSCTFTEAMPGQHEISIAIKAEGRDFTVFGQTANNGGVNARVTYKSPMSGGETFLANDCTISTALVEEGGGEGMVNYECFVFQAPAQPARTCPVEGQVYVKNCKK